ncbi:MAG: alpha/beta hydrolase [Chloroflexota bacterium]|nr:alpha/beta hydrolase [Chloroflexota bacterium]
MAPDLVSMPLPNGRSVDVLVAGSEEAPPLLFHHGTPGARIGFEPFIATALARGVRFVSYSRPGYGDSTRRPGRAVADCAADTAAIMDRLGAPRFYTVGWSGGGPHALACAALLPDRVIASATIAGVAPYPADGLDWLAGMGPENVREFGAAMAGPDALGPSLAAFAEGMATVTGENIVAALGALVSDVDEAALNGELGAFLAANVREGLRNGTGGWLDDDLAFVRDWGFDVATIAVPVAVWQGPHDRMVPFAHGEWLTRHIPGVKPRLEPEHGHLSLAVGSFGRILDDLLRVGGGIQA